MRKDRLRTEADQLPGAVVLLLLLGGLFVFWNASSGNTANTGASVPPSTTGSAPAG